MRTAVFLFICIGFFSCKFSFHAPEAKDIEQAVTDMYKKRNVTDVTGGWDVKSVKVNRDWAGDDKRHHHAEVTLRRVRNLPPMVIKQPKDDVEETIEINLAWRGGQWIVDEE